MSEAPVLIVAPLREEVAALLPRLQQRRRARIGGRTAARGTLGGVPVVAAVIGDGVARAERALGDLLGAVRPRALIGIGVAGGLDPALGWGVVLASREVRGGASPLPQPDPGWQAAAESGSLPLVPFAIAPRIVPTPEAKRALRAELGGDAACVDLESGVLAVAAQAASVPYLLLRAVVDEAGETVSPSILAAEDEDGHVGKARVVAAALRRPSELGRLKAIQKRVAVCAERLADAVETLLRSGDAPR